MRSAIERVDSRRLIGIQQRWTASVYICWGRQEVYKYYIYKYIIHYNNNNITVAAFWETSLDAWKSRVISNGSTNRLRLFFDVTRALFFICLIVPIYTCFYYYYYLGISLIHHYLQRCNRETGYYFNVHGTPLLVVIGKKPEKFTVKKPLRVSKKSPNFLIQTGQNTRQEIFLNVFFLIKLFSTFTTVRWQGLKSKITVLLIHSTTRGRRDCGRVGTDR